jgi:hypothetical protein
MTKKFTLQWLLGTKVNNRWHKYIFQNSHNEYQLVLRVIKPTFTISVICLGKSIQHTTIAIELKGHEAAFNHPEFTKPIAIRLKGHRHCIINKDIIS